VVLCQRGPRILDGFEEHMSARAARELAQLGVEVMTGTRVEHVDAEGVIANGQRIVAKTVVWAAGVMASPLGTQLGIAVDRAGRVPVARDLSVPGHPNVFVVGDLARFELPNGGLAPGLAATAIQQGRLAAHNVLASVRGRKRKAFHYHDKGMLATVGKHRAIAQLRHVHLTGYFAWWLWLFVHLFFLIGIHNRLRVFRDWTWSYVFSRRGSRLILSGTWRLEP
jgi:NADH dehydrogenase